MKNRSSENILSKINKFNIIKLIEYKKVIFIINEYNCPIENVYN